MKSNDFFHRINIKLVFYFNVLNFYGLKYHKISIELCLSSDAFCVSILLASFFSLCFIFPFFKHLNFHFFFSSGGHSFSLGEHSQSHFLQSILCHNSEKNITQKKIPQELSLVILTLNGTNFWSNCFPSRFLHVSFISFYKTIKLGGYNTYYYLF